MISLPRNSFAEAVSQLARTGATGIGLWEGKLEPGRDAESAAALVEAGLNATLCYAARCGSILPSARFGDPPEPEARIALICRSIERLARFNPVAVMVSPGSAGHRSDAEAYDVIVAGLRRIAEHAQRYGVRVAVEPVRASADGAIASFGRALAVLDEVGAPNVGVALDIWQTWDDPQLFDLIADHADRVFGVQVNDWRNPTRMRDDRVLPGEGIAGVAKIIAALISAGYTGWYDLEVMSDETLEDSLWRQPHLDLLERAAQRFDSVWHEAVALAGA
jgi:sugar phosphate isomerase/epimerase